MVFEHILQVTMWASFLIVFLFYLSYFLVLRYFYKKSEGSEKSLESYYPYVSLIVPVYNEEKIIRKKIQNIEQLNYPKDKIEPIFVDGCSTDGTPEIIQDYIKNDDKFIRLIRQSRRTGYNEGIYEGVWNAKGNIIIITTAEAYYAPDTIHYLVRHFKDPKVGAVTGKEIILNEDEAGAPKLEAAYRSFYDFMRAAETRMDSTPDLKGEVSAIRKEICTHLIPKTRLSNSAAFDCCVAHQAKMEGYKTVYEGQATYCEYAPATLKDRMKQQIRRGTFLIGSLMLFKNMILNKKYGKFGLIILPAHFVMQLVLPWIFLLGSTSLLFLTIMDPIKTAIIWLFLLLALLSSAKTRLSLISFIQSQIALIIAIFHVLTKRKSLFIDTIPSTRGLVAHSKQ